MRFSLRLLVPLLLVGLTLGIPGAVFGDGALPQQVTPDEDVGAPPEPPSLRSLEAAVACDAAPVESPLVESPATDDGPIDFGALSGRVAASCNYCTSREECYSVCGTTDVACVYDPYCGDGRWCACFF